MDKSPVSDATISRNVSRQLAGCGLRSPCRIDVQTRNGEVTLSGAVQFVHQRNAAVQAIRTVEGVKRVIEKLKVTPPARHQYAQPSHAPKPRPTEPIPAESQPAESQPAESQPAESQPAESMSAESTPAEAPAMLVSSPTPPPVNGEPANSTVNEPVDTSFDLGDTRPAAPQPATDGMYHSRKGDSYTFECGSLEEAEKLRAVLAAYPDWLKKHAWVGAAKATGGTHQVTLHAKSVIEFLRQEGF